MNIPRGKGRLLPYFFLRLKRSVSGATAVEYGLLAGLVALGIAGGIGALADLVNALFDMIGETTSEIAGSLETED